MTDRELMQQPEALRLADWIERGNYNHEDVTKAAAELRRLHEVNAELVEALKVCADQLSIDALYMSLNGGSGQKQENATEIALAALVKATGEQQ